MSEPTKKETKPRYQGLRLNLAGAPLTPHFIPGLPGFYRPDRPTPVGGPGELTIEVARSAAADPSLHVDLVDIPAGKIDEFRKLADGDRREARSGFREARRNGGESELIEGAAGALKE